MKCQNQPSNLFQFKINLSLSMCVLFYSSFVCISAYANVYLRTTIIKQNIKITLLQNTIHMSEEPRNTMKYNSLRVSFKGLNCAGDHTWSSIWIPTNNISSLYKKALKQKFTNKIPIPWTFRPNQSCMFPYR